MKKRVLLNSWAQKNFGFILFLSIFSVLAVGCPPPPEEPPSEDPPFLKITRVSNGTPEIGDTVTIEWEYGQDVVVGFSPQVVNQAVKISSLTFDGKPFEKTFGCHPEDELPAECMSSAERKFEFVFHGPVTFQLIGFGKYFGPEPPLSEAEWDHAERKLIRLTLPDMSFEVEARNLQDDHYPSREANGYVDRSFDRAFGIYEDVRRQRTEDGIIDEAAPGTELNAFFPTEIPTPDGQRLFPSFFARSYSPYEKDDFELRKGGNFSLLQDGFRNSEEGAYIDDSKTHADIMIVAVSYRMVPPGYGDVQVIKTDHGEVQVFTFDTPHWGVIYNRLILQIDLRSVGMDPEQYVVSDVHIGDLGQGLVLSAFDRHEASNRTVGEYDYDDISIDTSEVTWLSNGEIKGAVTGINIVTDDDVPYSPIQTEVSVKWSNIPIYPDTDISGLKSTYEKFLSE